jgi:hypothetical protein
VGQGVAVIASGVVWVEKTSDGCASAAVDVSKEVHLNAVNVFGQSVPHADPPMHRMPVQDQVDLPVVMADKDRHAELS